MVEENLGALTRRTFIKRALTLGAGAAVGLNPMQRSAAAQEDADSYYNLAFQQLAHGDQKTFEKLFSKGVELDMKKGSVEEILQGVPIEFVKYDRQTAKTNHDDLVFQESLKPEEKKPVLVMFYHNKTPNGISDEKTSASKREAVLFKNLSRMYAGQIRFVCFEADTNPNLSRNNYQGLRDKYEVLGIPSIVMYSNYDTESGEKPVTSNGVIKKIDIFRGGPKADAHIQIYFSNFTNYWIPPLLLGKDNSEKDGKIYKYSNSGIIKKVKG